MALRTLPLLMCLLPPRRPSLAAAGLGTAAAQQQTGGQPVGMFGDRHPSAAQANRVSPHLLDSVFLPLSHPQSFLCGQSLLQVRAPTGFRGGRTPSSNMPL